MQSPTEPRPGRRQDPVVVELASAAQALLEQARAAPARRAARTLAGGAGAPLKQTLLAMAGGTALAEHASPGAATLQVLLGRVRLLAGDDRWELAPGDHVALPDRRHEVQSMEDAVVLLTVAAGQTPAVAG